MSDRFEVTGLDIGILIGYLIPSRFITLVLSVEKRVFGRLLEMISGGLGKSAGKSYGSVAGRLRGAREEDRGE